MFVVFLMLVAVFMGGCVLLNVQGSIILCVHFLLIFSLYRCSEYLKDQLKRIYFDIPPDASPACIVFGKDLKNVIITLILGASGIGVYSLSIAFFKINISYVEQLRNSIMENYSFVMVIILTFSIAYYLFLTFSVFAIWIKSFCIRLSLIYAPATPSNKKIIEALDAKMKKYTISGFDYKR